MWLAMLPLSPRFLCKALSAPTTMVLLETSTAGLMGLMSWFSIRRLHGILYASYKEHLHGASYMVYLPRRILHTAQSLLLYYRLSGGGPGLRFALLKAKPSSDQAAEPLRTHCPVGSCSCTQHQGTWSLMLTLAQPSWEQLSCLSGWW